MNQKDYYTFKELLLGLREEYRYIQRELNVLKNYIILNAKELEDYYFQINSDKIILLIKFLDNKNRTQIEFYKDNHNRFTIDSNFNKKIKITNTNKFSQQMELLLNSRFFRELEYEIVYNKDEDLFKLWINPQIMILSTGFFEKNYICYGAREDIIKVSGVNNIVRKNEFNTLLQTKIPKNLLNDYHKLIMKKELQHSDIIFPSVILSSRSMQIDEQSKNLVLIKRK